MKFFTSLLLICIFLPILFLIVFTPEKCEHENTIKVYSFQFENSTAASSYKTSCVDCKNYPVNSTSFRGTPTDQSYLEAVKEHSDIIEVVPGEYYTVTAIVSIEDYDFHKTRINCKVENKDCIVGFSVEFREGFEELVSFLEKGDEITFRGKLYDTGFGFTDCELIK